MGDMFGGGGGQQVSAPTSSTVTQSNLPAYAQPYFENIMGASEATANTPYQAYGGPRIADFSQNQLQAFGNVATMQQPGQFGTATNAATGAVNRSFTDPGVASQFMNPYMQNVVDIQKREAARQAGIAQTGRDAQFTQAGAYGGSRQGVADAEAQRNLAVQQNDIQAQGANSAWGQAQNQFNAEQGQQLQGAGALGNLGGQQQAADLARNAALASAGSQQQQQQQAQLTQNYQDFLNQRDYQKQQLNWQSGILRGVPVSANSNVTGYTTPPSIGGQVAGLGIAGLGLANTLNKQ